ncbi:peptide deformylase [Sinanaerobacter chloroacetimidivorans]|jgi:peptide deformylase|uniref:Peptide deformylase n=1 Tax=Sinanaerobacter chloroacetimidivorans TaxID=2818044 RepID=A0A8J7W3I7_9FIRM|nr:peptide deformylase [Sinanaerobacter chloroacetimidivorans]MBR0600224.1 peptide deformylase [Sinanaerobacter chloroacetimidivorans]
MALRNIVTEGDDILRKRAREVSEIDERITMILDDMLETMRAQNGVGIAAPQVGILKRMFIVEVDDQVMELINPEIVESDGIQLEEEGCLSIPGKVGTVERPSYIKMKGLNREGKEVVYEGNGLLSIALSHEYDHLNGVLYIDKAIDSRDLIEE